MGSLLVLQPVGCIPCTIVSVLREAPFLLKQRLRHSGPCPHNPAVLLILNVNPATFHSLQ